MNRGAVALAAALCAAPAAADVIRLTNGRVIEADRVWYEGSQVRYEKNGGVFGLPRALVASVAGAGEPTPLPGAAQGAHALPPPTRGPRFRLRYEGGFNEALGLSVLETLGTVHKEFTRRLGFEPDDPVTVVLEMGASTRDDSVPEWAAGVNDGAIRVPVQGLERPSPQLVKVLRHELAHSFIAARTGGNCPTWLQEGVSQWLEGGDPHRDDPSLVARAREGRLLPLLTLEAPFQTLPPPDVPLAYAESLSAVAHILKIRGEAGVGRLLAGLGDRMPSEEALPVALALSYPEFQRSWESHLGRPPGPLAR